MSEAAQELVRTLNADLRQHLGSIEPASKGDLVDLAQIAGAFDKLLSNFAQDARAMRREAVIDLLRAGHKPTAVARAVNLSPSTVKKWQETLRIQHQTE